MNSHLEKANALRNEVPVSNNCAQTVLRAYAEELGITEAQAKAIAANFGGGMKCGATCGAIAAGLMVLGGLGIESPQEVTAFRKSIAEKHGGLTDCADLLKRSVEMGLEKNAHCDGLILEVIEVIEQMRAK